MVPAYPLRFIHTDGQQGNSGGTQTAADFGEPVAARRVASKVDVWSVLYQQGKAAPEGAVGAV